MKCLKKIIFTCIIILSSSVLFGQSINDYAAEWKKVEDFNNKGLPKSALDEVQKIYALATKDKNEPQVLKSLISRIRLQEYSSDDADTKNIKEIEEEIIGRTGVSKSILYSLLAEMYEGVFQDNRYKLYSRTNTTNFNKADINTWSTDDYTKKISALYLMSLQEEQLLKLTKLAPFDPIITKGNSRYLRPTLFDLIAQRALNYFESTERYVTKAAYSFEIKDEKAFAPAKEFAVHHFVNTDTASLYYKAILIYQDLLSFHEQDREPEALIDVDIQRLAFMKRAGVMPGKTELYIAALKQIENNYKNNPSSAMAGYLIAQEIYDNSDKIVKLNKNENIYTIIRAKDIAEEVARNFPKSEGGVKAQNLIIDILHQTVQITSEKINLPGQPFRALVEYKNYTQLHLRIISLTEELKKSFQNSGYSDRLRLLANIPPKRAWTQSLPPTTDFVQHSVEIKVDALSMGEYALLASVSENFNPDSEVVAGQYFYVSGISFLNNKNDYFILDRESGKPLEGARVQVWDSRYDYNLRKYVTTKAELLTSNNNGFIRISGKKNDSRNIRLDISYKDDKLFLSDEIYKYNATTEIQQTAASYEKEQAKVFFFTDRSIYRPGQLIYFKGIAITTDYATRKPKILNTKDSISVVLFDANEQKADSVKLLLNEYGSISGKFRIPENRLNGQFSISATAYNNSQSYISVEEYKRPKFYTEFDKLKGTYKVNDRVKVIGFAKAYAGNNIDGARVTYKVTRIARFLYPWMWWRWGLPQSQPMEITHGETKTAADGKFSIEFEALPDLSINKNTDPVFDYTIEADITDLNGETRSGSITVPVGYKALDLQIHAPGSPLAADSFHSMTVTSKNLSGSFEPTLATIQIFAIQPPARLLRSRYWSQPDQFIMSKEEYVRNFPNDIYADEDKKETWPRGVILFQQTDSTKPSGEWLINQHFKQGYYVAEVTAKDRYGQEVKNIEYFELYDLRLPGLPTPSYSWNTTIKNTVEPGENAEFITGTSTNLYVIQQINKPINGRIQNDNEEQNNNYLFTTLNNEKKTLSFPVTENDRGGYSIFRFFVKNNRFYSNTLSVDVPWTNKDLDISFDTYRDKTLPGSEEKWKVKIRGYKGEKLASEMLAGMYDASLDQFKEHSWNSLNIWPYYNSYNNWEGGLNFSSVHSFENYLNIKYIPEVPKNYDEFAFAGNFDNPRHMKLPKLMAKTVEGKAAGISVGAVGDARITLRGERSVTGSNNPLLVVDGVVMENGSVSQLSPNDIKEVSVLKDAAATALYGAAAGNGVIIVTTKSGAKAKEELSAVSTRKNFNETAFFYPELRTDKEGNVEFSFTMPEALTQWKLMTFAHTKDLASGYAQKMTVTQKDLMMQPNAPRFLREGDKIEFTAKIVNLSDKEITGNVQLQMLNASTLNPVDTWFKNNLPLQSFTARAGQSTLVKFNLDIPYNYNNAAIYRIVAKAGDVSDGEEAAIPVLTNRMLVIETMPLPVRGNKTKLFTFEKLLHSGSSNTLTNHALTVEYTTNPAWYAVQALPYLMEYPYECAEQTFNRYYANAIASKIVRNSPNIKAVFEKWKTQDTAALLSNLQKNEELKSVLLQETPWVLEAQNESQQKKNVALLFDMVKMTSELEASLTKLQDMQSPNGGFVWFKGGQDDRYMTQYIITGIGHLKHLDAFVPSQQAILISILDKAIPYLDQRLKEDYDFLVTHKVNMNQNNLGYMEIQYLYMRSFFPEYPIAKGSQTAYNYYREQSRKYWLSQSKYMEAMIALSLYRTNDLNVPKMITKSLKENAIINEELGMYWKDWSSSGYYWYQAPIESQAMMIEAFNDIDKDVKVVDDLKTWLLKNKQTTNWHTTKATAEACYALLLQGTNWLTEEKNVTLQLGNTTINSKDQQQEAGSGYFKTKIDGSNVTADMANISVTVTPARSVITGTPTEASWGAVYWQYFENLDKITFAETPLKLNKKLFIERNTDRGAVISPIEEGTPLKVGDKIKVRIELRVDREMEYVHMKDMRASCMEPINVISEYKYQGGLSYYESTKDASTNFFFALLPKGTFVFEYPMFVTHAGNFSNGITTIQCMYAPEFTSHSEGVRVTVSK